MYCVLGSQRIEWDFFSLRGQLELRSKRKIQNHLSKVSLAAHRNLSLLALCKFRLDGNSTGRPSLLRMHIIAVCGSSNGVLSSWLIK